MAEAGSSAGGGGGRHGAARVTSVDALTRFRPALVKFVEEARTALGGMTSDAGRTLEWIRRDRVPHWTREVRAREDAVNKARSEVNRKASTPTPTGSPPSTVEERKALAKAQRRLEEAKESLDSCRHWERHLDRAVEEYKGATQSLQSLLASELDEAVHALDRMSASLEAYVTMAPDANRRPRRAAPPPQTEGQPREETP